jgi:hypothetical protein
MVVDGLARLFRHFEFDWAAGLLLANGRSIDRVVLRSNVSDFEVDNIATA